MTVQIRHCTPATNMTAQNRHCTPAPGLLWSQNWEAFFLIMKYISFLYLICGYLCLMYICAPRMCRNTWKTYKRVRSLSFGVTGNSEKLCGCQELNPGPLRAASALQLCAIYPVPRIVKSIRPLCFYRFQGWALSQTNNETCFPNFSAVHTAAD